MEKQKNVNQLLIAKDISRTGLTGKGTTGKVSYSDLADGEIVVCTPDLRVLSTTAGSNVDTAGESKVVIVQRTGSKLLVSDVIEVSSIKGYSINSWVAATQQLDYVGYNGTAGSIETLASNIYSIRLTILGNTRDEFGREFILPGTYKSSSVAATYTQQAIAKGLTESLINNYSRQADIDIKFERVNSGAQTAVPTGTVTFAFVKGSKYITATDIDDATDTDALAVGDILVIGTASTSPGYVITAINTTANTATLDIPFQGASQSIVDTGLKVIVAASEGNWGVKIEGVAREFVAGKWHYAVVNFNTMADFGDDAAVPTVTNTTASTPGIGTYGQVAQLELELQMNEAMYRNHVSEPIRRTDALSDDTYDMLTIEFADNMTTDLGGIAASPKTLTIAIATTAIQADVAEYGIAIVLDEWIVTDWAIPGITTQTANLTAA